MTRFGKIYFHDFIRTTAVLCKQIKRHRLPLFYIERDGKGDKMDKDFKEYHRGEIYYANLNPVYGSEQGGIRPVLILQNNIGNHYSPTLVVAPMTKRIEKKPYLSTHVILNRIPDMKYKGNSLFMLEQLRAIDKRRMKGYIGKLTKKQMELIDQAARISLGLGGDAA